MSYNLRVRGKYANNRQWLHSKKSLAIVPTLFFGIAGIMPLTVPQHTELFQQPETFTVQAFDGTKAVPSATPVPTLNPTTQKQEILKYIVEKFGDRAADAITMLNKCENHGLRTDTINKGNSNGTWDVGVFQINVDPKDTAEVEKLKDWKYNVDRAYQKFHSKNDTFYMWTCGDFVGDRTYVHALRGK